MKIAVDMMGGDNAPLATVEGAVRAAEECGIEVVLVGDTAEAKKLLRGRGQGRITLCKADGVIGMCDAPTSVIREKSNSSMAVAAGLLKKGEVDAMVSAGNTGALFTAASIIVRRIPGVRRAAIGTVIRLENPVMMLDMGANLDSTPDILDLYARMGSVYVKCMLGIEKPRVALLNNGTEEMKGTDLYRSAFAVMRDDRMINFVGNCEGTMISRNFCDVLVCDGFSGNICLKTMEGTSSFILGQVKSIFKNSIVGNVAAVMIKSKIDKMKSELSSKSYGGAPLLGISKPVIKAHGNSDAEAIFYAIRQAKQYAESGAIETIKNGLMAMGDDRDE